MIGSLFYTVGMLGAFGATVFNIFMLLLRFRSYVDHGFFVIYAVLL